MVQLLELGLVETLADSEIKSSGSVAGKNRSISFSARTRGTDSTYIILTSFACGRVRRQYRLFCIPTLLIVFFFSGKKGKKSITNWPQADSSCVLYCEDCDRPCYLSAVSVHQRPCKLQGVARLPTCRCSRNLFSGEERLRDKPKERLLRRLLFTQACE